MLIHVGKVHEFWSTFICHPPRPLGLWVLFLTQILYRIPPSCSEYNTSHMAEIEEEPGLSEVTKKKNQQQNTTTTDLFQLITGNAMTYITSRSLKQSQIC